MKDHSLSPIEPLEARIAPALTLVNALPDIVAGVGKTGAVIDLSGAFLDASSLHTKVQFTTNFDTDTTTPGLQAGIIVLELFDDAAPLTVQNFLQYVNGSGKGDLDGTFFHRSVSGFVLQGGGFESTNPGAHIPVGPEVHNEYDSSRSNLLGTIAMAKTEVSPNSATSEFFINLGDNASNLDNQNGGFTVFGKVISGMSVVNAIAAQPLKDYSKTINGALGSVPVQPGAGNSPTPGDFITITDAKVLTPTHTIAPGVTFSLVSITEGTSQVASDAVTGALVGTDSLSLNYTPGKSGVATVKIKASQPGEPDQFDEFQVTVKPNLIASITSDGLAAVLTPGVSGKATVKLTNNGAALLSGNVEVSFYLSKITDADPNGRIFDAGDTLVGSISGKTLKLASGASTSLSATFKNLPNASTDNLHSELFRLIAVTEVHNTADGAPVSQLFADDNTAIDGSVHRFLNAPNLVSQVVADKLPGGVIVPGDTGAVTLKLSNNGAAQLKGTVDVTFYLSKLNAADPNGLFLDTSLDLKIGVLHNLDVNLATGKSTLITGSVAIPTDLVQTRGEAYRVIASVTSVPGSAIPLNEFDAADNLSASAGLHNLYNAFGALPDRKNVPLNYTDANGNRVTLTLKGGGFGEILTPAIGELDLALYDTTAASVVNGSVTAPLGAPAGTPLHTDLQNIYSQNSTNSSKPTPAGTVALGMVDVHGGVEFLGGIKSLTLGNLIDSKSASHLIDIGAFAAKGALAANVNLGSVTDYGFRSYMPVNSITVKEWLNTNTTVEQLAMVSLKSFSSAGNLEQSLYANIDFNQVAYSKVKLASFTVGGALDHATVQLGGDVGKVALDSMTSSYFYAGVTATPNEAPDFVFSPHTLDSFIVKGANGLFKDSVVAAGTIGSISFQNVDGSGAPGDFGIVAYAIKNYLRLPNAVATNLVAGTHDKIGNYSVRVI